MPTLQECRALDAADPLAPLATQFELPPGVIYLDGNSLGALPRAAAAAVAHAVSQEWGQGLIRSWNDAGWIHRAQAVGDALAPLVGAGPGEVMVADSTSINLHKVLWAAMSRAQSTPARRVLLTEAVNFPTDRYIAQGLCEAHGWTLRAVAAADLAQALAEPDVGLLMLTQVNYRSGALHDMAAINRACAQAGVLTVWDLAHSAGAVEVDLKAPGAAADFAVGCGYKFLNGGPGAPAFVWVHPRHVEAVEQPLRGWLGHAAPFAFETDYRPAPGIGRYTCGTPPILSLTALQAGVQTLRAADAMGGMAALRAKSLSLTRLFIDSCRPHAARHGLWLLTPEDESRRGSQVSWACPAGLDGYGVMRALIGRGVIGDFRAGDGRQEPDILRFGFAPLYNSHEQAWHAAAALGAELEAVQRLPQGAAAGGSDPRPPAPRPAVT